ncbi:MAG: efflux RND transporter permease subunit, partial [Rhizobacter sp.]
VADITPSTGPNQINRRDLNREINFDANAFGRSSGDVSAEIKATLDAIAWPPGYRYSFGGSTKNMTESFQYAVGALALAIVFIYMILASQFKSFLQPLALMSALPLTLIGVVLTLLMFRSTLNMFSIIGIVMLMGLVTKNAILLVDFAIRSRAGDHGEPPRAREDALLHAAQVRLRPILMTTLAMVFGMVPLAFALSEGSEQRARQIDQVLREMPEVRYTVATINSGFTLGKIYGSAYVRLVDRKDRQRSVADLALPMRQRLARIPGITVTNIGPLDLGGGKSIQFSVQGTDLGELERLS